MIRGAVARARIGWNRFWFEPASPLDLAIARILFCSGVLLAYLPVDFSEWGTVGREFWMPIPLFAKLHIEPLSASTLVAVSTLWRVALVATVVGFCTGLSATIAAITGLYLLGLPHN